MEDVSDLCTVTVHIRFSFRKKKKKQSAVLGPAFLFSFFSTKSGRFGTKYPRREEGTREGARETNPESARKRRTSDLGTLLIPGERTKSRRGEGGGGGGSM